MSDWKPSDGRTEASTPLQAEPARGRPAAGDQAQARLGHRRR
jgi:hypothetical protein